MTLNLIGKNKIRVNSWGCIDIAVKCAGERNVSRSKNMFNAGNCKKALNKSINVCTKSVKICKAPLTCISATGWLNFEDNTSGTNTF